MKTLKLLLLIIATASVTTHISAQKKRVTVPDFKVLPAESEEIDLPTFIGMWLEKRYGDKRVGLYNMRDLLTDSMFTYFGVYYGITLRQYKVRNTRLLKVDYKSIDPAEIKQQLYKEFVPDTDKRKLQKCNSRTEKSSYVFSYNESDNTILIQFHFKETCDFFFKVDKHYTATYNVHTRSFISTF